MAIVNIIIIVGILFLFAGAFFLLSSSIYYLKWLDVSKEVQQGSSIAFKPVSYRLVDCLGCPVLPAEPTVEQPQYDLGITSRAISGAVLAGIGITLVISGLCREKYLKA